jgi:hypothetical protein
MWIFHPFWKIEEYRRLAIYFDTVGEVKPETKKNESRRGLWTVIWMASKASFMSISGLVVNGAVNSSMLTEGVRSRILSELTAFKDHISTFDKVDTELLLEVRTVRCSFESKHELMGRFEY